MKNKEERTRKEKNLEKVIKSGESSFSLELVAMQLVNNSSLSIHSYYHSRKGNNIEGTKGEDNPCFSVVHKNIQHRMCTVSISRISRDSREKNT